MYDAKAAVRQHCQSVIQGKPSLGFKEAIRIAEKQVEAHTFGSSYRDEVRTLCRVMAEVYMMPSDREVRIDGEMLSVAMVKDVYKELNSMHVQEVLISLSEVQSKIKNIKAYLRTALYNSVFELEVKYYNEGALDL